MKVFGFITLLIMCSLTFAIPQTVYAHKKEDPYPVKYHVRLFKRYKKRAAQQDVEIQKRKKMKGGYQNEQFIDRKPEFYSKNVDAMNKHCDAIIVAATTLKEEYELFANWHKMRAEEIKKNMMKHSNVNVGDDY